jgi:galactose mutarotase-like enzyme
MQISISPINGMDAITFENDQIRLVVVPALGGKISSIFNKQLGQEFLWTNASLSLQPLPPGSEYDPNFFGGMDELIPNDMPETIDGIEYPDHGELWTTRLEYKVEADSISLFGTLPLSGLHYKKTIRLDPQQPRIMLDHQIRNDAAEVRHFLWKLHPALRIEPGDAVLTSATSARVVDPAYSRFTALAEFSWPHIQGTDASVIPEKGNEVDFFFLWNAERPEMSLVSQKRNSAFTIQYEQAVFPFQWYFASYGGFLDHYTAVLEPCSAMPMSVAEAAQLGQCTVLEPGQTLETSVRIHAGTSQTVIS